METATETHLDALLVLLQRLSDLRLQESALTSPYSNTDAQLRAVHTHLAVFAENVKLPEVQSALQAAQASEKVDSSGILFESEDERRINAKRQRLDAAEPEDNLSLSKPLIGSQKIPLPPFSTYQRLTRLTLPDYIRHLNKTSTTCLLHLWAPSNTKPTIADLSMLRLTVKGLCFIYLKLAIDVKNSDNALLVTSAAVFGTREKKPPHSYSDYLVFQQVSQFLTRILAESPTIPLQVIVEVVSTYNTLFSDSCVKCESSLSVEERIPPVHRLWVGNRDEVADVEKLIDIKQWEARHPGCHDA